MQNTDVKAVVRGFVVNGRHESRLIVTAAHCLPSLPEGFNIGDSEERTYSNLVGPLDREETIILVECLFVDPVADIAVLGAPDGELFYSEHVAYGAFVKSYEPLAVPERLTPRMQEQTAWMLYLADGWCEGQIVHNDGLWFLENNDTACPVRLS